MYRLNSLLMSLVCLVLLTADFAYLHSAHWNTFRDVWHVHAFALPHLTALCGANFLELSGHDLKLCVL